MTRPQLSEAELHAYVDGQLPPLERARIEALLDAHPEQAERVRVYLKHKNALHQNFDAVLDEPVPEVLRQIAVRADNAGSARTWAWMPHWSSWRLAASVLLSLTSGVAGWVAHGQYQSGERLAQAVPLARQAAVAHVVYSPDVRRPVEIKAEHEDQLVTWLSKRLGTPVRAPKLGTLGFELVGGRLLPGNSGPVAQFMYQDASGQRLTLYVSTEIPDKRATAFRFSREGLVNVFYWIDGKYGYALSAGIDKATLARVATAVYEQLERG